MTAKMGLDGLETVLVAARVDLKARQTAWRTAQDNFNDLNFRATNATDTWASALVRSSRTGSFMDNWENMQDAEQEAQQAWQERDRRQQELEASAASLRQAWADWNEAHAE